MTEPDDVDLEDRIAYLNRLCATSSDDTDVASVRGGLGELWLDVYERDGGESALAVAVQQLGDAVSAAPSHPERFVWFYRLGSAYRCWTDHGDQAARYERAIGWFDRLLVELPRDDDDRDVAVTDLAATWMERFLRLSYGPDHVDDERELIQQADRLVARLATLRVDDPAGLAGHLMATLTGLARLERYQLTERREDLDRGIEALADSVWQLPSGEMTVDHAVFMLADAYWCRVGLDGSDRETLTLCIEAAERGLGRADEADHVGRSLLTGLLACAYHARWLAHRERADLDAALESWRLLIAETGPDETWAVQARAELLMERAKQARQPSDVDEAVGLLTGLLERGDRPEADLRLLLAQAYEVQAALGPGRAALALAERELDRVSELSTSDDDRLRLHARRLEVAADLVRLDVAQPHTSVPPSVMRLEELIREAHGLLDRAVDADLNERAGFAGVLAGRELSLAGELLRMPDLARVRGLIEMAARRRPPPPGWLDMIDLVRGVCDYAERVGRNQTRPDFSVERALPALTSTVLEQLRGESRKIAGLLMHVRASQLGDLRAHQAALRLVAPPVTGRVGGSAVAEPELDLIGAFVEATMAFGSTGQAGAGERLTALAEKLAALPPSVAVDQVVRPVANSLFRILGRPDLMSGADNAPEPLVGMDPQLALVRRVVQLMARLGEAVRRGETAGIRDCAAEVERIAPDTDGLPFGRFGLCVAGGAIYLELARREPRDRRASRRAVDWYEEATGWIDRADHPLWTQTAMGLAEALRRSGRDRPRSLRLGLSALAAQARHVMLQGATNEALVVARRAIAYAMEVAHWSLDDGALDTAVTALDEGRGLVLQAVTSSRDVADRLAALGHDRLADEWRLTAGQGRDGVTGAPLSTVEYLGPDAAGAAGGDIVPDTLRASVLAAFADAGAGLLSPVTVDEIQAALAATRADALVYLLPTGAGRPGRAVIVPATGPVEVLMLPALRLDHRSPIGAYARSAAHRRDATVLRPSTGPTLSEHLAEVGTWSWRVAMGELVARLRERRRTGRPHVVLVPIGALALVPWHAAYVESADRRRYVVEDLVISYSPSARLFCGAARWPVVAIRSALVVGNPNGDLAFAGLEARAIHQAFYPGGTYLGRDLPDRHGIGSRDEVLRWIVSAGAVPSVLHFACHGRVDPDHPADAELLLANDALTARDLVDAARLAALVVDQVFLAACTTNTTGRDYDEAFSLASAFLAAGARTVFGSLWAVGDAETSLLMFMTHHYLVVDRHRPADALSAAQLWMLNPHRRAPKTMPAQLATFCDRPELADPVAWAAFTHLGR